MHDPALSLACMNAFAAGCNVSFYVANGRPVALAIAIFNAIAVATLWGAA